MRRPLSTALGPSPGRRCTPGTAPGATSAGGTLTRHSSVTAPAARITGTLVTAGASRAARTTAAL